MTTSAKYQQEVCDSIHSQSIVEVEGKEICNMLYIIN